jgi:hypothetical protein
VIEELEELRSALASEGVAGVADLGRFVSNTDHFRPSEFDERAALPVLVAWLPRLHDRDLVATVAAHLARPWARPTAFPALLDAFVRWAPLRPWTTGWAIGDALAVVSDASHLALLLEVARDRRFGRARQQVVGALWRFKKDPQVGAALQELISDPEVALHAMSALRRTIGNAAALPLIETVRDTHPEQGVREIATREARKAARALAR